MKKRHFSSRIVALPKLKAWAVAACVGLSTVTSAFAGGGAPINFWGGYSNASVAAVDPTQPTKSGRSYFTTSVEEIPGGARLTVEMYHGGLNQPVSISVQAAINDGKGNVRPITLAKLDDNVSDNPTLYYSKRTYDLQYSDLNAKLKALLPASAQNMEIGPGSALFLIGEWPQYSHQWGGIARGGIFFMPEKPGAAAAATTAAAPAGRRPEELDLAYPIPAPMAMNYNTVSGRKVSGLKVGGQIRSRVESEGKYQVPLKDVKNVKKRLFEIANDPNEAAKVLGSDWTVTAMMKYMKKDAAGNYILDADGMPTPDPMVDTYYDNDKLDAAKNDIAIRYRWTEGNGTGAWNLKPGLTNPSPEGVVDRIEFGVDATDDKPETIKKFADSMDPLNPFKTIRDVVPGSTPSDFLKPSVKITDTRFKFEFKHRNGLLFEVSLDEVMAASLRGQAETGRYVQLEADIDHLSTASANVAKLVGSQGYAITSALTAEDQQFLAGLGSDAILDGRPVMHTVADLDANSPVKIKHQADFALASTAIVALRNEVLGTDWIAGPQKYALAAEVLDLVKKSEASGSVQKMIQDEKTRKGKGSSGRRLSRRYKSNCAAGAFTP